MSSPLSLQQRSEVPPAPESHSQMLSGFSARVSEVAAAARVQQDMDRGTSSTLSPDFNLDAGTDIASDESKPVVLPGTMSRLLVARSRIFEAACGGLRIRTYEVALDLDMSEFHFARQFRLAFDRSPHVYYDEVRAATARAMLAEGLAEGTVARRIGFRRPAELRALLGKRPAGTLPPELARA